ncbi:MAG: AMP phosphorylase [Thermoprotei archaeon]
MNDLIAKILDIHGVGYKICVLHSKNAADMDLKPRDRITLNYGGMGTNFILDITDTIVKPGEVGIPREIAYNLGIVDGALVKISPSSPPVSISYIKKKMQGAALSKDEIESIVRDSVNYELTELEIAAFLMAEQFVGMNLDEIVYLTEAMVNTGERIHFDEPVYDVHSVGGVPGNSKASILIVPIVASAGILIPKTSSRAITSPAGTADTMEVLARVDLTPREVKEVALKTRGVLVWGGRLNLAPADDIYVRIEHILGIDPEPQMVASILSKKLAMDAKFVLIDLPVGPKAKVESMDDAKRLARLLSDVAERLNMNVKCAITYGGQPLGYTVGPALEAREALEALEGKGSMSLVEKALSLAGLIIEAANIVPKGSGYNTAKDILTSGKALKKLREIISAQGGNPNIRPDEIPIGDKTISLYAPIDGYVTGIDNSAITAIARAAGAPSDKGAGVRLYYKAGYKVKKGEPILTIHAENNIKLNNAYMLAQRLRPIIIEGMLLGTFPEE